MKNVLVIYQNIPESTDTYLLKGISGDVLDVVKDCNNRFINDESGNESCDKLNYWLSDKKYFNDEWQKEVGLPKEECSRFANARFDALEPIDASEIDFVVITGFVI